MKTMKPMNQITSWQQKLARNALAGMAATAVYLISRLLLTPFVLRYLDLAEFGLWSMCFVILSYASMGAFGVNNTYIRYTARFHGEGQDQEISKLLSTGIFCMLLFSTVFLIALFCLMPVIHRGFHIDTGMSHTASVMILGTAVVFCFDLTLGSFRAVLEGLQEISLVKKIFTIAAFVEIIPIVFFLSRGVGVEGMLYAYMVRVAVETGACLFAARRLLPSLRLSPTLIYRTHFRHLFVFGGKVQVLGGIAIFLSALDRMVISAIIGLSAAGMFEVGRKLPFTAKSISGAAFGPFFPAAASLEGTWENDAPTTWPDRLKTYGRIATLSLCVALVPVSWLPVAAKTSPWLPWLATFLIAGAVVLLFQRWQGDLRGHKRLQGGALRKLYLEGIRHINLINMLLFAFLAAVAGPLVTAWVGPDYEQAVPVMILLAVAYLVQQSTGPVVLIFRGIDRCGQELEYLLVQLILALVWIPAGTYAFGLLGSAGAIAATTTIASAFLFWRSNHAFQISLKDFASRTLAPMLLPLTAAVVIYGLVTVLPGQGRMAAALQVVMCGLCYLGMNLPLAWKLVLTAEEKQSVLALVPPFRGAKQPC
jgi:O-antigen/teichoic acid export membrane protein